MLKSYSLRRGSWIRGICLNEEEFRTRTEELVVWLVERAYKEVFVREQIARANNLDRVVVINQGSKSSGERKYHISLVVNFSSTKCS